MSKNELTYLTTLSTEHKYAKINFKMSLTNLWTLRFENMQKL